MTYGSMEPDGITPTYGGYATQIVVNEHFVFTVPDAHPLLMPVLFAIPMQLLAYHVAVALGRDVDQPRNLAKSVTVE